MLCLAREPVVSPGEPPPKGCWKLEQERLRGTDRRERRETQRDDTL